MDEDLSLTPNTGAIIPVGPPPADTVTIKMIDRVAETPRFLEYDMSPNATIEDLKNKVCQDLKYKPSHFNILTPRQMVLHTHTPLGGLDETQPLFLLKTAIAKVRLKSSLSFFGFYTDPSLLKVGSKLYHKLRLGQTNPDVRTAKLLFRVWWFELRLER